MRSHYNVSSDIREKLASANTIPTWASIYANCWRIRRNLKLSNPLRQFFFPADFVKH